MKKQPYKYSLPIRIGMMALFILVIAAPAIAAPIRVAILPFEMHAEKNLDFLQEGIRDMLESRLASPDEVTMISDDQINAAIESVDTGFQGESRALLVGGKLKADYVLFGSITMFGESVSIDVKMVDVTSQRAPLPFFVQTSGMGEVIPKINQIATAINAKVFGRAESNQTVPVPVTSSVPQPAQQPYNLRMHPEKLLQSGSEIAPTPQVPIASQGVQPPNPAFIASAQALRAEGTTKSFWKSQRFDSAITGLAVADIDNDGMQETVIVTVDSVMVYRNLNNRFSRIKVLEKTNASQFLAVDVADVNGNGYAEIFVSALDARKERFSSFIIEYDGSSYRKILSRLPWHFRVVSADGQDRILLGQKQPSSDENLFSQPIFRMHWDGNGYVPQAPFLAGGKANVLGTAVGHIIDNRLVNILAYSNSDRVVIFRPGGGDVEWKSDDAHGGNLSYFQRPGTEDPSSKDAYFFPMRLLAADLDGNGTEELIVASNKETTNRLIKRQRSYKNSRFISFSWREMGVSKNWESNQISGRISDFVIADFDNDGIDELVGSVVLKEGRIALSKSESVVSAYELSNHD